MTDNHIQRVAIVGAGGHIGKHFAEALLQTGKHTVTALTRADSNKPVPKGTKRVEVNYDEPETLVAALKGQQFLIITLSVFAPQGTHSIIVKAAAEAGVPYVMPNVYGGDMQDKSFREEGLYGAAALECLAEVERQNMAYVVVVCGFWYEWSLAMGEQWFGFDLKNKNVTLYDDGTTKITTSTWLQCGRAVAAFLSQPETTVARWKNQPLRIASFTISQRDMLDSIHRVTGSTDADWTISYEPTQKRYKDGLAEMQSGDRRGFAKAMYARGFYPNGGGNHEETRGLDNVAIGLSKDSLDEATKRGLEMDLSYFFES